MGELQVIKIDTAEDSIQDTINNFLELVDEVPWGNSDWQNKNVIVNGEMTPERAYRHSSLRIMNRLQALNECYYALRKDNIMLKKFERQLLTEEDELERELIQLEIDKIKSGRPYTQKLVRDAINEIDSLAPIIQSMGKLSKEQFESAEDGYFKLKYENMLKGRTDVILGLESMGINPITGEAIPDYVPLFDEIVNKKQIAE